MIPEEAHALFDRHASTYARVNTVVSAGLDVQWRAWVAQRAVQEPGDRVLDAMTGTGEVAVLAARLGARVTAADISTNMLARASLRARDAGAVVRTVAVDLVSDALPRGWRFDAICLSFGLRYTDDPVQFLSRLSQSLTPEGRLVLLEFCVPEPGLLSRLASAYFFGLLPRLGALLGASRDLYDALGDTTRSIGTAERIESLLEQAGLVVVERRRFGFGLVAGFVARPHVCPFAKGDNDDLAGALAAGK